MALNTMKFYTKSLVLLLLLAAIITPPLLADDPPSIKSFTESMDKEEGFFTYFVDNDKGAVYLLVDRWEQPFIYINSLSAGVGSNDIGLDRGQLGDTRLVHFERHGEKVFMVQPNLSYRATSENRLEKKSVEEAFARSILWGFKQVAVSKNTVLIDMSDFLMRDAHGVIGRLKGTGQGSYRLDQSRSAVYMKQVMNFPKNSEFEALLTFTGDPAGRWIQSVTPTSESVTVRQHHSFVKAPDDKYNPRKLHPRAGYFGISYKDYSTPIGTDMTTRYITRHRLEKKNPEAKISEPVEPIVYYLDPGTPEPVRSALLDGARWWSEAFEAAGFKNAFKVKMLPEDAHPLDVRYNMIQWVHRSTRGWSYGASVVDPRTGEIIKGHVSLGSLRVRQDYLIAEGLLSPYEDNQPDENPMLEMALARIRQLSAHEIGHTLGIAHNFAASVNNRASVMDYPHPMVKIEGADEFNLTNAYDTGIGEWDIMAIRYGYSDFAPGENEELQLNAIVEEGIDNGLLFISDRDARPLGGAHPKAHLWDNGKDAVEQLGHILNVRRVALARFSENNIQPGTPMAELEKSLVPIYLYHRYQIEAAVKLVGGFDYRYNSRGDKLNGPEPVSEREQHSAISALMRTISPEVLTIPEKVMQLIPPRPIGYPATRELFEGYTGPIFDPYGAAEAAADMTLSALLHPERAMRLIEQHTRDANLPSLADMIQQIVKSTWLAEQKTGYAGDLQRIVNHVALNRMLKLAASSNASDLVRAEMRALLVELREQLSESSPFNNTARVLSMAWPGSNSF